MVNDFIGEIKVMESFKGMQNIVSIEDFKVVKKTDGVGWRIYIRMELLTPFNQYVSSHPLTEGDIIRLGTEICTALEYCQSRDLIHRDIKPENIFVNDFGCFKLGDFGIARKLESMTSGMSQKHHELHGAGGGARSALRPEGGYLLPGAGAVPAAEQRLSAFHDRPHTAAQSGDAHQIKGAAPGRSSPAGAGERLSGTESRGNARLRIRPSRQIPERGCNEERPPGGTPVSYTHLTLPTKLEV